MSCDSSRRGSNTPPLIPYAGSLALLRVADGVLVRAVNGLYLPIYETSVFGAADIRYADISPVYRTRASSSGRLVCEIEPF